MERRLPAWVPAALGGIAAGLVGVALSAWLLHRKAQPPAGHPTLAGVAVLTLSTGGNSDEQQLARDLEGCLPGQLALEGVPVIAPEKIMTLQAQTNGVYDRASARALGLAVGARWVLYGNFAGRVANLFVAEVLDDRSIYADSSRVDDAHARCVSFAAAAAARLKFEPPQR